MDSVDFLKIADERMGVFLYNIEEKETRGYPARWYNNELRYPLHIAASEGKSEIVKYLLDNGFPVDSTGEGPWYDDVTPLSIALIKGLMASKRDSKRYLQTISLLLERGAKVNNIEFPYEGSEVIGNGIYLTLGPDGMGNGAIAIAREAVDRPGEDHRREIYNLLNDAYAEEQSVVVPAAEASPAEVEVQRLRDRSYSQTKEFSNTRSLPLH